MLNHCSLFSAVTMMACIAPLCHAQIPGSAFRDVKVVHSLKDGDRHGLLHPHMEMVGIFPPGPNRLTLFEWIKQPIDETPYELHEIVIDVDEKQRVIKTIHKEAIVYDLTGKDPNVYYRIPDKRWGAKWVEEQHTAKNSKGQKYKYQYCRAAEGPLKGWYLSFQEKVIKVPGHFDRNANYLPAFLTKEPTPSSPLEFEGGHHSGVSP